MHRVSVETPAPLLFGAAWSSIVNIRVKATLVSQQLGPRVGSGASLRSVCVFSCVVFLWEIELNWRLV